MFTLTELSPYKLLAKVIALGLFVALLLYSWHRFTNHYVLIGEAKTQVLWDAQKVVDKAALNTQIAALQRNYEGQIKNVSTRLDSEMKGREDADNQRDQAITDLHDNSLRLRRIACVPSPPSNQTATVTDTRNTTAAYSYGIPLEIGEAAIRAKHEFVTLKDKFDLCVGILKDERK